MIPLNTGPHDNQIWVLGRWTDSHGKQIPDPIENGINALQQAFHIKLCLLVCVGLSRDHGEDLADGHDHVHRQLDQEVDVVGCLDALAVRSLELHRESVAGRRVVDQLLHQRVIRHG